MVSAIKGQRCLTLLKGTLNTVPAGGWHCNVNNLLVQVASTSRSIMSITTDCTNPFHFVQYEYKGTKTLGIKVKDKLIDFCKHNEVVPSDMCAALAITGPEELIFAANRLVRDAENDPKLFESIEASEVKALPAIVRPDKVIGVGLNYLDHCREMNVAIPSEPVLFTKFPSTICASETTITIDRDVTEKMDWEVELVIVIGKETHKVTETEAEEYIFGYTVANDLTAREHVQIGPGGMKGSILLAKSLNSFCPLASTIAPKENIEVLGLSLSTRLNNDLVQDSNTSNLIFKPNQLVSYLSRYFHLLPGDLILAGTPPGVGAGMSPPRFVQSGDRVTVEVDGVGHVTNDFK